MIDTLISGGDSFTEVPAFGAENWPVHLENYLKIPSIHTGLATVGNGFIYKKIIHELSKIEQKENVLVGIMWSTPNRQMFYHRKDLYLPSERKSDKLKFFPKNKLVPLKIAGEHAHWLTHPNTEWEYNKFYYNYFYDEIGSYIETIQHILHTQWYLKLHNIKYFMTCITGDLSDKQLPVNHPDIEYLYNQIDFSNWINLEGMMEFNKLSKLPTKAPNDLHPSTEQSKLFTEQVIIPHLKNKGYIN